MTVREMVKEHLEKNGYDGLFVDGCECSLDDLMNCGRVNCNCKAGYFVKADECKMCRKTSGFCLSPEKGISKCLFRSEEV